MIVLLRQRLAATGEWEPIQETQHYIQSNGLDLVVDRQDLPHWISGDGAEHENHIWVNDVDIIDGYVYDSGGPTIALGPGGAHMAVWSAQPSQGGDIRLFMATHNPGGPVTRHYYAGGQQLASRVDGVLYYHLPDPSGTSLLLVDTDGISAGNVLYDGYGDILASSLSPELSHAFSGPGAGLVYPSG